MRPTEHSNPPGAPGPDRGPGVRPDGSGRFLESAISWHLGILIVGLSWSFGGQIPWARSALLAWGTIGLVLFVFASRATVERHRGAGWTILQDLWPLLAFAVITGVACLNPSFKTITRDGQSYFAVITPAIAWLPSTARPDRSSVELWQFGAIVLSCYNITLAFRSRRTVRTLLGIITLNAVALSIFGTMQKLVGAKGLWFGAVESPQRYFFSTFVYHNHWVAFTLLNLGACLALLFHYLRRSRGRDVWHSPVLLLATAAALLAATAPLSASRSGSILTCVFLAGTTTYFVLRLIRQRRANHESPLPAVIVLIVTLLLAGGGVAYLARNVIAERLRLTTTQLEGIRTEDRLNTRIVLYRDTLRMAQEKPWFGWGLETYGDVFRIYNSDPTPLRGGWKTFYEEAHSDWLQSLAESGVVGTALLLLLGFRPLQRAWPRRTDSPIPRFLLAGCGLVLLYAWLEFPLANPSVMVALWSTLFLAQTYRQLDRPSA